MKDDKDLSNLSAYAIYKNLIPGVKSYQALSLIAKNKNKKKNKSKGPISAPLSSAIKETLKQKPPQAQKKQQPLPLPKMTQKQTQFAKTKGKKQTNISGSVTSSTKNSKDSEVPLNQSQNTNGNNKKGKNKNQKVADPIEVKKFPETGSNKKGKEQPAKATPLQKEMKPEIKNPSSPQKAIEKKRVTVEKPLDQYQHHGPMNQIYARPIPPNVKSNKKAQGITQQRGIKIIDQESISNLMSSKSFIIDSTAHGESLFNWLISPISTTKFFNDYWEKKPLLIKRNSDESDFYKWIISTEGFDQLLRDNVVKFGKNIDITSYTDGVRETHNPIGRAMPATLWDFYSNACSIRMLNPQTFMDGLYKLNASLQEYLGTFVGANLYLTPPNSQGFAPHYDDIEAFILQVEGKKRWRLYAPRTPNEELPAKSSRNFNENTDNLGKPILDVILEEGDLLYFPRGIIHQANALDVHSMHLTVSCYQQNTYGDLLKEYLPLALEKAIEENVEFRQGLPIDYLTYMGVAQRRNKDQEVKDQRKIFEGKLKSMLTKLSTDMIDLAADKMGKKFIHDSLPPALRREEKKVTSMGDGEFMSDGRVFNRCEFDPDIEIKLLRRHCVRLIFEEDSCRLYFNLENSLEYHGEEPQFLEIPFECGPALEFIIQKYPEYVRVSDLPINDELAKVQLAADLWERGILSTKMPLTPVRYDEDDIGVDSDSNEDMSLDEEEYSFDEEDDNEEDNGLDEDSTDQCSSGDDQLEIDLVSDSDEDSD